MSNLVYRKEIDGLRAIAVLAVVLFHLNENLFSGGFIGVDIFFVISGFLISSVIFNDIKNKKFTIINFYERRIRRLLPALLIVLIFSFFLSIFILDPVALKFHSLSQISTLLFSSNILFSYSSEYFSDSFNPLLHTWSLGVEEQFYLIYPLAIFFLYKKNFKIFVFIIIISFSASLILGQMGGNLVTSFPFFEKNFYFFSKSIYFDFFAVQSRIWELLLGCITFLIHQKFLKKNS